MASVDNVYLSMTKAIHTKSYNRDCCNEKRIDSLNVRGSLNKCYIFK